MNPTEKPEKVQKDTKIAECTCTSAYQDEKYGVHQRVHNPRKGGGWRCTVCGKTHV